MGFGGGQSVDIREDAVVQIHASVNGYYIVVNNAPTENDEAAHLFGELSVEAAITTLEHLASKAFSAAPEILFKGAGLLAGVLVSLFTTCRLTREIFIRSTLMDGETRVTYCLLV